MTHKKDVKLTPSPQDAYFALGNELKGLSALLDTLNGENIHGVHKPSVRIWKEILNATDDIGSNSTIVSPVLTSLNTPEAKSFQQNLGGLIEQFSDFNPSGNQPKDLEKDMTDFKSGMITEIMASVKTILEAMNKVQFPTQKAA